MGWGSGHASLFSLSADNAMLQLVSRSAPRVLESQVGTLASSPSLPASSTCASVFPCFLPFLLPLAFGLPGRTWMLLAWLLGCGEDRDRQ